MYTISINNIIDYIQGGIYGRKKVEIWKDYKIRFVQVNGKWWAVASDITRAMGFSDSHTALRKMPSKYKGRYKVPTLGGEQESTILNEKGLYRLIMRSNKPEAEVFQDWVYDVIQKLREALGLEGFEVFRLLDKEHQKQSMTMLHDGLHKPQHIDYIKANTIANKAISTKYGYPKIVKREKMSPQMLKEREGVLDDTVELMNMNDKYNLGLHVSKKIYKSMQQK